MLSAMGADEPSKNADLEHYLEAKASADQHLRDSGLNFSILRAGRLTDDMGMGKVKLALKLDKAGEIPRDDVAFLLVMSLAEPLVHNMTFEAVEGEESIKNAMIDISKA